MALPTIPCYWSTRKDLYEQAIVKRRNHDVDFRQKWANAANYFHKSDVSASKQKAWESEALKKDSFDVYKKEKDKEEKRQNLERRRLKLAQMLKNERTRYEAELKGYSPDNYSRLEDMKERVDTLRSAREEKRKQIAEEKIYEHWRINNPDLRRLESEQMKEHIVGSWVGQVEERQERAEIERMEKEKYEEEMEKERLAALELEKQKEQKKLEEEKKLKQVLRGQMMELKKKEIEAEMLKQQQEALEKQQLEIEELEEERKKMEAERQKQEFGRFLLRQHKTQMMRKSRKIQEELEMDKKILENLIEKEKELESVQTARREKAKADAAWMKKVIEDQLRLEKAREAELDMLYQDEAARVWQKREAEWERERIARERLMKEVLDERQNQIEDRMEDVRQQQEESLRQREILLREIEIANQMTRREQEEAEQQKEALKLDLREQITARHEQEVSVRKKKEAELNEEKKAENDYEEFLQQETERMKLQRYNPKFHGKKQAWM
ncbi:hypothetical protein CHS0354_034375 [Potamilus streckersoni]|uniref:Trichoplein keratin filament-binding protein n=1 Tax=Potamilus streckersoni TaxID=2493646 RepID=A0AAE0TKM0_9BIVA|nr:hypothetical protein CHS0354_034375 [Potamilus streckersoni]